MDYTIEITIDKLEVNKSDGAVYNIFYTLTVSKGDISKSLQTYVRHLPVNENSFTQYEDLTQDQVVGWITPREENVEYLKGIIQEEENEPTYFPPLPWQS
jgi:hypothetical protein